jgi:hypothetical protein
VLHLLWHQGVMIKGVITGNATSLYASQGMSIYRQLVGRSAATSKVKCICRSCFNTSRRCSFYVYAKGIVRQSVPWSYELCMKWSFSWEFSPMQSLNMCNQRWRRWVHSSYSTRNGGKLISFWEIAESLSVMVEWLNERRCVENIFIPRQPFEVLK